MRKKNLPIIKEAHRKEWLSQREFESVIEPWKVDHWNPKDYGIDATVELTRPIRGTKDLHALNQRFHVQLKCTDSLKEINEMASFPVHTDKIEYWYRGNLPTMLVVYDRKKSRLLYKWIDTDIINELDNKNLGWRNQKSVTIRIPTNSLLSDSTLRIGIQEYVERWKVQPKNLLIPGKYFELQKEARDVVDQFRHTVEKSDFASIQQDILNIQNCIDHAIYRIAIAGPSRAGKSTLINALLRRRDVSPVRNRQTTGVPIEVLPAKQECLSILFQDKTIEKYDLTDEKIKEYASQEKNSGNRKKVAVVRIELLNKELEKGIALYDTPGLDDANELIETNTWSTLGHANSVIYMMDASTFRNGGFSFRKDHYSQINELGNKDCLFLVFNKIDDLREGQLEEFQQNILEDLNDLDLIKYVGNRIFYIKADESLKHRTGEALKEKDSVAELESAIWQFMLNENKFGLSRLKSALSDLENQITNFKQIVAVRFSDHKNRVKLEQAIREAEGKVNELNDIFRIGHKKNVTVLSQNLEEKRNAFYNQVKFELNSIPPDKPLPNDTEIRKRLFEGINVIIQETNAIFEEEIQELKDQAETWFKNNLTKVREVLNSNVEQKFVDFTDFENYEFKEQQGYSFLGPSTFIALAIGFFSGLPELAAVAFILTSLTSIFLSKEERRRKKVKKITTGVKENFDKVFESVKEKYIEAAEEHVLDMEKFTRSKLNNYFNDLRGQAAKFKEPLSESERKSIKNALTLNEELLERLVDIKTEINEAI
ncbi:MAG: DUF4365 domain-containing protein [Bacteroidia bacterium]